MRGEQVRTGMEHVGNLLRTQGRGRGLFIYSTNQRHATALTCGVADGGLARGGKGEEGMKGRRDEGKEG